MPYLDEQRLEEINVVVCDAMAENQRVSILYHKNQMFIKISGYIHYLDTKRHELRVMNEEECVIY